MLSAVPDYHTGTKPSGTVHITTEEGFEKVEKLVIGFSVNVCNMVLSNELDPYQCLKKVLDGERTGAIAPWIPDFEP